MRSGARKVVGHKLSIYQQICEKQLVRYKTCEKPKFSQTNFPSTVGFIWLIEWYRLSACLLQKKAGSCFFWNVVIAPHPSFPTLLAHLRILSLEVNPLNANKKTTNPNTLPPVWSADVVCTKGLLFHWVKVIKKDFFEPNTPPPNPLLPPTPFPPMRNSLAEVWQGNYKWLVAVVLWFSVAQYPPELNVWSSHYSHNYHLPPFHSDTPFPFMEDCH